MTDNEKALYDRAVKRIRDKQGLMIHVISYVLVNCFLVLIWAMNDFGGTFWPMFPMFGWGIAVVLHWWAINWGEPTDDAVRREMERLRKQA